MNPTKTSNMKADDNKKPQSEQIIIEQPGLEDMENEDGDQQ